jgi:hypothetical protein
MSCPSFSHVLPGTKVRISEHIAFGSMMNWQLWGTYPDKEACQKEIDHLRDAGRKLPQNAGSENYACLKVVMASAACVDSDDQRIKEK